MIEYEDECVGCPPEIGCMGSACPHRNVPHTYCDYCGDEARLYDWEGDHVCKECVIKEMDGYLDSLSFAEKCELLDVKEVTI